MLFKILLLALSKMHIDYVIKHLVYLKEATSQYRDLIKMNSIFETHFCIKAYVIKCTEKMALNIYLNFNTSKVVFCSNGSWSAKYLWWYKQLLNCFFFSHSLVKFYEVMNCNCSIWGKTHQFFLVVGPLRGGRLPGPNCDLKSNLFKSKISLVPSCVCRLGLA